MNRVKNRIKSRITAGLLTAAMAVSLVQIPADQSVVEAAGLEIRETTTTSAGETSILVGVEGIDCTSAMQDIIDEINETRLDACTSGDVPDPRNKSRMLTESDYVPIRFGVNCQKAAVIRAAEGAVYLDHTRPDGTRCFTVGSYFGVSCAENLAWGNELATRMAGWIGEKSDWVNQTGKTTGHYTSMINPNYKYVGIATFNPSNDAIEYGTYKPNWACTSGEFTSSDTPLTDYEGAKNLTVIQKMEVKVANVSNLTISGDALIQEGATTKISLLADITYTESDGSVADNTTHDCPVYDGVTWTSSDDTILEVSADGKLTTKGTGQVTITATIGSGSSAKSAERTFLVVPSGVTVTGVEDPDMVYTPSEIAPQLSKTAKANLSDGSSVDLDVVWGDYDTSLLDTKFTSNEFDVTGTAMGYEVTQRVHVNAGVIQSVYTDTALLTTDSGVCPKSVVIKVGLQKKNLWTYSYPASWSSTYYAVWDKDTLNQYKLREGGDFEIKGYMKITTDNGEEHFDVVQKMHVNPATVTKVELAGTAEVTTDSGTAPIYPKATVTWSNGDVTEEDLTWANAEPTETDRKYMTREGGDYTVTGTYGDESCELTVHVNPATPASASIPAKERTKTVPSGTPAALTDTATITWSNGDTTSAGITWGAQSHDDYGKIDGGTYTVNGTAEGLQVSVTVTVLPATIQNVEQLDMIETVQKKAPVLPKTVHVVWSNEDETDQPVTWETIPASSYATPDTTFNVSGTITDFDGKETTVTATVHVNERQLQSIAWKKGNPVSDTSYYSYKKADLTGTLIATYDNDETEEVELSSDMITTFDATSKKSTQTVTVTYTDAGVSKTTTAVMHLIQRTGISVATLPDKTEYIEGQPLETDGIVVKESLDDGTVRVLPEEEFAKVTYAGYVMNPEEYGTQTISVILGNHTCSFDVTVRKKMLSGLKITGLPKQTTYVTGQPLDLSDLVAKAVYDNGEEKVLSDGEYLLRENAVLEQGKPVELGTEVNTDSVGTHKVYVICMEEFEKDGEEYTRYASNSFNLQVLEKVVQSIEFKTEPSRLIYPEGDLSFDNFSDAVLLVHNNNDYDEIVSITEAVISGFDIDTIGIQEVTVSYGGKSLSFEATVREKRVASVYAVSPSKTEYFVNEVLDLTGGEVVIAYDNGTYDHISLTDADPRLSIAFADASGIADPLVKGEKTLVISWDGTVLKSEAGKDITIQVTDKKLKSIAWKGGKPATDTSYYSYNKSDLTGTLVLTYENADPEEIAFIPEMITVFDADSKESTQTVTISVTVGNITKTMNTTMKLIQRDGILVSKKPATVSYIEGQTLDVSGIELKESLDNGTTRVLSAEETAAAVYTGYDMNPAVYGTQTVTVTLGAHKTGFPITVRKKQLENMELETVPAQLTYVVGQPLALSDLVVYATYDNGSKKKLSGTEYLLHENAVIQSDKELDLGTEVNTDTLGRHKVYVIYSEEVEVNGGTGTRYVYTTFDLEVIAKVVESIEMKTLPSRLEYPEGDVTFDHFSDGVLLVHNNNDYDETVPITEATITGFDIDTINTYTVTVEYGGKTTSFEAKVRAKRIDQVYAVLPARTLYLVGETLDLTGGEVVVDYDNGTEERFALTAAHEKLNITLDGSGDLTTPLDKGETEETTVVRALEIRWDGTLLQTKDGQDTTIQVTDKKLKSIGWKGGKPAKNTSYYAYDKADLDGTLIAYFDNADPEEIPFTQDMITGFDAESKESTQKVTISYTFANETKTMTTEMKLVKRSGIKVIKAPDIVDYLEGSELDPAGIRIAEVLDNGEQNALSGEEIAKAVYEGFVSRPVKESQFGKQTVKVTVPNSEYGTYSTTFTVNVRKKALYGLCLKSKPATLTYVEGQKLSVKGIVLEAVYDNGDSKKITVTTDMLREGVTSTGLGRAAGTKGVGNHTISVLYSEIDPNDGETLYCYVNYTVNVIKKVVQSIEYVKKPSKTTYPVGDLKFNNFGGITIRARCNNGYTETVKITSKQISGFNLNKVGKQTVTITYGGKKLKFTAKVTKKKVASLIVTAPKKRTYVAGQKLKLAGAKIKVTYNNGTKKVIPVTLTNKFIKVKFEKGGKVNGKLTAGKKKLIILFKKKKVSTKSGKPIVITVKKK